MTTLLSVILLMAIHVFAIVLGCGLAELSLRIGDKRRAEKRKPTLGMRKVTSEAREEKNGKPVPPPEKGLEYRGFHKRDGEVASPGKYPVRVWHIFNGKPVQCSRSHRCELVEHYPHYLRLGQAQDAIYKRNLDNSRSQSDTVTDDSRGCSLCSLTTQTGHPERWFDSVTDIP